MAVSQEMISIGLISFGQERSQMSGLLDDSIWASPLENQLYLRLAADRSTDTFALSCNFPDGTVRPTPQ